MSKKDISRDRTAALTATIVAHAVALLALLSSSPRMSVQLTSDNDGSALQVSIVDAPSPSRHALLALHDRQTSSKPAPTKQSEIELQAVTNEGSSLSDSHDHAVTLAQRDDTQTAPAGLSTVNSSNSAQWAQAESAQSQPDVLDPLAELRRLRAQAERQRQQEDFTQIQMQNARVMLVLTAGVGFTSTPSLQIADVHDNQHLNPFPYPSAYASDTANVWALTGGSQPVRCMSPLIELRNDSSAEADWIDCLLNSAARDIAFHSIRGVSFLDIRFTPTLASRTEAGIETQR